MRFRGMAVIAGVAGLVACAGGDKRADDTAAVAVDTSTCSCKVFHSPQFWHLPVHVALIAPQFEQTNLTPNFLAINVVYQRLLRRLLT